MNGWRVVLVAEVDEWFLRLDAETSNLVAGSIDLLEEVGPTLGRPVVDRLRASSIHNLKELRPGSAGRSEVRIIFCFDPRRTAILLVAGNKRGEWNDWYRTNITIAEDRYRAWLSESRKRDDGYDEELE